MRRCLVPALVLSFVAAAVLPSSAQSMGEWRSIARGQIQQIWQELKAEYGFGYAGDMRVGALEEGDDEYFEFEFVDHREYLVVAICDNDCYDVDLLLYDEDDNVVMVDEESDDSPVLRIPTGWGGIYYIEAAMPGCSVEPCYYAVQVLQRYPGD